MLDHEPDDRRTASPAAVDVVAGQAGRGVSPRSRRCGKPPGAELGMPVALQNHTGLTTTGDDMLRTEGSGREQLNIRAAKPHSFIPTNYHLSPYAISTNPH